MGISSNGVLAFGFDLGEDLSETGLKPDDEGDWEFEDLIAKEAGIEPWSENAAEDRYDRKKTAIAACPVDLVQHCSFDYPMYILAVRGTYLTASRGYAEKIAPEFINVPPENIEKAKKWCDDHRIKWQEPSWILASLYG